MKKYSDKHTWVILAKNRATIGLSSYAIEQLGEITFIELPNIGDSINQNDSAAFIESAKAASDIYTPMGGKITKINSNLKDSLEQLNEYPEDTWIFTVQISDANEFDTLMDELTYTIYTEKLKSKSWSFS
jgi:glycine cleavage system H protein